MANNSDEPTQALKDLMRLNEQYDGIGVPPELIYAAVVARYAVSYQRMAQSTHEDAAYYSSIGAELHAVQLQLLSAAYHDAAWRRLAILIGAAP